MAKRLTDSRKWDDGWFIDLDPAYKLMWIYVLDKCNHSGVYKICIKLEECCLGFPLDLRCDVFRNRIIPLKDDKFFIPKFIEFQYGVLSEQNKVHKSVICTLKNEGVYKQYASPLQGAKDKDKVKDKDNNNESMTDEQRTKFLKEFNKKKEEICQKK
jgi:hypothetical protein